ncbi:tellurite resistance TerB family protein [Tenacibaculum xiamenense]|uniref:tellurite resistance TerB family protein n=1 Tax=Tenacibaculum xiamenense TaxID=1261553 RepID=UPI003893CA3B
MSIVDLYESSYHRNNMAHFSAIVNIALADGHINFNEESIIKKFVKKLDINTEEYKTILKNPSKYPIIPQNNIEDRLERLLDLFKITYSDHKIDDQESKLLMKYAIALGFNPEVAKVIIWKSIKLFEVNIDVDEYSQILDIL